MLSVRRVAGLQVQEHVVCRFALQYSTLGALDPSTVALHQQYHDRTVEYTTENLDWLQNKGYVTDEALLPSEQAALLRGSRARLFRWPALNPRDIHHVPSHAKGKQRFSTSSNALAASSDPGENVFVVSLPRRPSRLRHALQQLRSAGLCATVVDAVDGDAIERQGDVARLGVRVLPGYSGHKNHGIRLTTGEVGCFMSHYAIWHRMVEDSIPSALILEDDFDFQPDFVSRLGRCLEQAAGEPWNLFYVGRSPMEPDLRRVSRHVVEPGYTLWTVAYILRLDGARALLTERVHGAFAPLDDFFSLAFGRGMDAAYNDKAPQWRPFIPVVLRALAASPPLVMPYVGSMFLSDTAMLREGRTRFMDELPE